MCDSPSPYRVLLWVLCFLSTQVHSILAYLFFPKIWEILALPPRKPMSRPGMPPKSLVTPILGKICISPASCGPISGRLPRKSGKLASMVHSLCDLSLLPCVCVPLPIYSLGDLLSLITWMFSLFHCLICYLLPPSLPCWYF